MVARIFQKINLAKTELLVIGFNNVVKLKITNLFSTDKKSKYDTWEKCISQYLDQTYGNFQRVNRDSAQGENIRTAHTYDLGTFLFTYARDTVTEYISNSISDEIKFNMIKTGINKAAVLTRFNVCDTSFCFINAHLSSGKDNVQDRINDIKKVFKEGFQKDRLDRLKDRQVEETDQIYFFGNLNFRLQMPDTNVRLSLEEYSSKSEQGDKSEADKLLNQVFMTD